MKHLRIVLALCAGVLASCSGGPNAARVLAERKSHALAVRCAEGWFQGLPFTVDDQRIVEASLLDWHESLATEEALLGWPAGGAK